MKFLIQRVNHASVKVESEIIGKIGHGFLVFVGIGHGDDTAAARDGIHERAEEHAHHHDDDQHNNSGGGAAGGCP